MRGMFSPYFSVGLIPGVLDGGKVPPSVSSSGENSSRLRFLEVAEGLTVIRALDGTGIGLDRGSVDIMGTND